MKNRTRKMRMITMCLLAALTAGGVTTATLSCTNKLETNAEANIITEPSLEDYYATVENMGILQTYTRKDISDDIIDSRNGRLIIERVIGRCIDTESGAGIDESGRYISYSDVLDVELDDVVCTYYIYDPEGEGRDIIARYDYIIDTWN